MIKFLLILIMIPNTLFASGWFTSLSEEEIILESIFVLTVSADWMQTKQAMRNDYIEMNPVLGNFPSQEKIDTVITTTILSHILLIWSIPINFREFIIINSIGIELDSIHKNYNNGIRISGGF